MPHDLHTQEEQAAKSEQEHLMSLPKQVQLQAEEADRIDAELEAALAAPITDEDAGTETPPEPTGQSPAPETPPLPPVTPEPEDTWQKRYQTLQGMFNAEVPRLNNLVRDLQAQVAAKPAPTAVPETPTKIEKLVTGKDIENFGEDLVDLMDRKAREVVAAMAPEITRENQTLKAELVELRKQLGSVEQTQGASSRQQYFGELARQVPDYEAINLDQRWLDWLAESDGLSGVRRQAFLDNAFEQLDVGRTKALFDAFKGTLSPAPAVNTPPSLERQITPATTRSSAAAAPPGNPGDRIFSMDEITAFYRAVQKGDYAGKDQERDRLESEIDQAVAAGRLTN